MAAFIRLRQSFRLIEYMKWCHPSLVDLKGFCEGCQIRDGVLVNEAIHLLRFVENRCEKGLCSIGMEMGWANLAPTHYLAWGGFGLTNHEPVTLWVGYGQSKRHSGRVWVLAWPIPNPSRCHPYLRPCWLRHYIAHTCKYLTCSKIIRERVLLFSNTDWWISKSMS